MIRLERLEALQREIRQDDVPELAIPTWNLVSEAIQAGRADEALKFLNYGCEESMRLHDNAIGFVSLLLNYLASNFGEEEIEKMLRERYVPRVKDWLSTVPDTQGSLYRITESMRGHYSEFTVTEETDKYVLRFDPCGSGGRLKRTSGGGLIKKAYPWSWGKSGISYYCTHCCLLFEIIPIELRGYPIAVIHCPLKPEDPCIQSYYKKPELVPEKYFTRVGKTKTMK